MCLAAPTPPNTGKCQIAQTKHRCTSVTCQSFALTATRLTLNHKPFSLPFLTRQSIPQVPFREELAAELRFVAKCSGNTKPVRHRKSSSGSRNSLESGLSVEQHSGMDPVAANGGAGDSNGKAAKTNGRKMVSLDD